MQSNVRKTGRPWTVERIRAYGLRMPAVDACEAVYDVGRTTALRMCREGSVDFRVLKCGRSYVVPTVDVLRLLGLDIDVWDVRPADGAA